MGLGGEGLSCPVLCRIFMASEYEGNVSLSIED